MSARGDSSFLERGSHHQTLGLTILRAFMRSGNLKCSDIHFRISVKKTLCVCGGGRVRWDAAFQGGEIPFSSLLHERSQPLLGHPSAASSLICTGHFPGPWSNWGFLSPRSTFWFEPFTLSAFVSGLWFFAFVSLYLG